ncbi:hypothetical protein PCASD_26475 [Puccinia coronata f. sp. avenae]|uniref:Uncharacterized protein n=1 Tax=Puccinia coronata f. sp. avenae TaxID=200324 RepID=A0A2N5RXN0_9BASI|nr:hypothetical protein PCASD_26475 [Puccinia coronata f. sp. avenae]
MALPAHPTPQSRPPPTDNPSNPCPIAQIAQKISQINFGYQLPRKYTSATHPSASLSDCFCGLFVVFSCPIRKNPPYTFAMFSQSKFFMNLGGPLPALPFANENPETQESYLAPLPGTPGTLSCRLFYEPGNEPAVAPGFQPSPPPSAFQLQACQAVGPPLGHPAATLVPVAPPLTQPRPFTAVSAVPRILHLRYVVFVRSVAPEILQDQGRSKGGKRAPAPKEWDKMWSKEDLVWKTVIMNWTWDQFKSMVIRVFGQGRDHFSTHINNVNKAGKLTNSKFQPFMGAVLDNPTSQVIICVSMADQSMVAKKLEREKAENESLALNYGNKEERPNVGSGERMIEISNLTNHIINTYGCDTKALAVRDPRDASRSIRISRGGLYKWSRAMMHNAPGEINQANKSDKNPNDSDAPAQSTSGIAKSPAQRSAKPTGPSAPQSRTQQSAKPTGPSASKNGAQKLAKPTGRAAAKTPTTKLAKPSGPSAAPPHWPASVDEDGLPQRTYTPMRQLANGRIMPPRLIPLSTAALDKGNNPPATPAAESGDSDLAKELNQEASFGAGEAPNSDIEQDGKEDPTGGNQLGGEEDPNSNTGRNPLNSPTRARSTSPSSTYESTGIYYLLTESNGLVNRSPAQKVHCSPAAVNRQFSRLNFASCQGGRKMAPGSPTCKQAGSNATSPRPSISATTPPSKVGTAASPPLPPLLEKALAITIDQFLKHTRFDINDPVPGLFIQMNQIRHWGFFQHSTVDELEN